MTRISLSLSLILAAACVFAQTPTGVIQGVLNDASGAVVPNA